MWQCNRETLASLSNSTNDQKPPPDPNDVKPRFDDVLVGVWEGQSVYNYIWVQLTPDGYFHQVDTSFDGTVKIETYGAYRVEGNMIHMQPREAQECNAWGCQAFQPEPIAPFPFATDGYELRAEDVQLFRIQ